MCGGYAKNLLIAHLALGYLLVINSHKCMPFYFFPG